ncbi:alpha/beta fold hydrolase [Roseobacter weihaiensis]|uniref:alpha/beta fold hydrolase n=1 Tax=Roseobacter weihaiensis TaxID=2763262 RepID=UPI001D09AFD4|nr:alpha/beta hydrolase [Roseobacter sp. H9]
MLNLPNTFNSDFGAVRWGHAGDGPPLVLVHGTPFSAQVWRRIAPCLSRFWTVYYFDLIGYGQSEMANDQNVSLGIQNTVFSSILAHWDLERPDVLAHDFGGATVLRSYFLDGLRYRSLTLFDAVSLAPWGSPFVQHVRQHEAAFAGMPAYMHDALLKAYLQTAAHVALTDDALHVYMQPWQGPVGQPAFYRQIAQMDQCYTDEIEEKYSRLDCPVQVLWGMQDRWIPIETGERLAKLLSDRPLVRVPEAGHLVQEDAPEAIIAAMLGIAVERRDGAC